MKRTAFYIAFCIAAIACGSPRRTAIIEKTPQEQLVSKWFDSNFANCGDGVYTKYEGSKLVVDPSVNKRLMVNYSNEALLSANETSIVTRALIQINNPAPVVEEVAISESRRLNGLEFDGYAVITPKVFSFRYFNLDNPRLGWSDWREGPMMIAPGLTDSLLTIGAKYAGTSLQAKTPFRASIFKQKGQEWKVESLAGLSKPDCSAIPK